MISLLVAGLVAGIVLSGRATDQPEIIARAAGPKPPAPAAMAEQQPRRHQRRARLHARRGANACEAVTNISSVQVVRRPASPFANDPFFQYFFGDQGEMFGRNRAESEPRLRRRHLGRRLRRHQQPRDRRRRRGGDGDGRRPSRRARPRSSASTRGPTSACSRSTATGLPVIPWGDSSKLKVAEWVMAVGNPFSLSQTVTLGIVSALGRANVGITQYEDFIQTDAAINPGNSGGALINSRGELVGINTAIFSQSGGYQGIGFAVPSNLVRRVVDDLMKFGQVRRGSIGYVEVMPLTSRLADELRAPKTDGIVVNQMSRDLGGVSARACSRATSSCRVNGQDHRRPLAVRPPDRRQRHRLDRSRRGAARRPAHDAAHPYRGPAGTPRQTALSPHAGACRAAATRPATLSLEVLAGARARAAGRRRDRACSPGRLTRRLLRVDRGRALPRAADRRRHGRASSGA